ncbi:BglG family transcription antiterminator LicT [Streptococcus halichoeri]|uniref:BglG family transcription antiterminator LicT n=1 Tax=Streptococcus halichoeri TaxID=254785 RepID=UPI001358E945|nr:PRD domain-containing protein [Streptococcus halichoeri]
MKIDKVYNNNVVHVKSSDNQEIIVMGKGLGFGKKCGDQIDQSLVEKTFVLQNNAIATDLSRVYTDLSPEEMATYLAIIKYGQEILATTFEASLYVALADHLHYTLERAAQGLYINNPLAWEIRKFYPKEYQVGKEALKMIFERLCVLLPEDEISSIALHFINAQKESHLNQESYHVSKMVTDILGIVRLFYGNIQDNESISYNRFITHLQYFAQRVVNGIVQGKNDSFLYEQVKANYPEAFACSQKIKSYIESTHHFQMSPDEQVYITIHIQRLDTSQSPH